MLKNTGFALTVCLLVVGLSLVFGSGRSMRRCLQKAENCYEEEVAPLLSEKAGYAANFTVIAGRTSGISSELTENVKNSIQAANEAEDMYAAAAANTNLDNAVTALSDALKQGGCSESDLALLMTNTDDYKSKSIQIRLCDYNDTAESVNRKLTGGFTGLLRRINGIDPAPLFS